MSSIPAPSMFTRELQTFEIRIGAGLPISRSKTVTNTTAAAETPFATEAATTDVPAMTDPMATTEDPNEQWFVVALTSLFVAAVFGIMAVLLFQMSVGISDAFRTIELNDFLTVFRGPA